MEEIIVQGGNRLEGVVKVEGAKNAVLPILAAAILAETGKVNLSNVPVLSDVFTLLCQPQLIMTLSARCGHRLL